MMNCLRATQRGVGRNGPTDRPVATCRLRFAARQTRPVRARRRVRSAACLAQGDGPVLAFGEGLFDCLADQKGVPKEDVTSWTPYPGGAPANVACALATLGDKVVFVSALGKDDLGDQLVELLKGKGVDMAAVQRVDAPTRDVLVVFDKDGDRQFVGFGKTVTTEFADCFISPDSLPIDKLRGASVLITGTLGLAYPTTAAAMKRAVSEVKSGGGTVIIDVNWRPVFFEDPEKAPAVVRPYVELADVVKLAEEEAEWLFGIAAEEALKHPEKVLEKVPAAKGVLLTAGGRGSSYAFKAPGGKLDITGYVPVLNVKVVETTGAGDAFLGGFTHKLVEAGSLEALQADPDKLREAVEFAAACGAFTTTGPGAIAAQPTYEQAEELLKTAQFAAPAA